MTTPTVVNLDAVQPFIDMITSGYFNDHEGVIFGVSDSSGAAFGATDPNNAWMTRLFQRMARIGGKDGGVFISPTHSDPTGGVKYDQTYGLKGRWPNPYAWYNVGCVNPGWANGTGYDGYQCTGGLGGFNVKHGADVGTAKAVTWAAGIGIRRYMTPLADSTLADNLKRRFVFVSAQSASSAPASMSTASAGDEILDGDVYWYCYGTAAGTEAARQDSHVYLYGDIVQQGGRTFTALGGKTGATEATWPAGINVQGTETGLTTKWENQGPVYKQVNLPPFRTVDVIYADHAVASADTLTFAEDEGGFSASIVSSASASAWGKILNLAPASGDLCARTLQIKYGSGETWYEGLLTHKYADQSGLHFINTAIGGLGFDKIVGKATTTELQDAWVGADVIPEGTPVLFVFQLGRNDWVRNVTLGTTLANQVAVMSWAKRVHGDNAYFLWIQPWPGGSQGTPTVADAGFNYHTAMRTTAEAEGACSINLSMIYGGVSGATSFANGDLCPDATHPSDRGHTKAAEAIISGLGLPDTDTPAETLTTADKVAVQAACAAALTAAGVGTLANDAAVTRKMLTGTKIKRGGAVPTSVETLDENGVRVVKFDITGQGSATETWTPE